MIPPFSFPFLAFDTTGPMDSLCLRTAHATVSRVFPNEGSGQQSAFLVPRLQNLLKEHSLSWAQVHSLATVCGPGSFTGIRIGLATFQGLLLGQKKLQSWTVTRLELLAMWALSLGKKGPYHAVVDMGQGMGIHQYFDEHLHPLSPPYRQSETDWANQSADQNADSYASLSNALMVIEQQASFALPQGNVLRANGSTAELLARLGSEQRFRKEGHTRQGPPLDVFYGHTPVFHKKQRGGKEKKD